jgi:hypothetical protein
VSVSSTLSTTLSTSTREDLRDEARDGSAWRADAPGARRRCVLESSRIDRPVRAEIAERERAPIARRGLRTPLFVGDACEGVTGVCLVGGCDEICRPLGNAGARCTATPECRGTCVDGACVDLTSCLVRR